MKVGVDSVLLGAWVQIGNSEKILDIGTGTGILSLMLAQKSNANIIAIDIDKNAYLQAKENIKISPWASRISVFNLGLQEFTKNRPGNFDLIICNPPYFTNSLNSPDQQRNLARHDNLLSLEHLLENSKKLLTATGNFSMIYPYVKKELLLSVAEKHGLYPIRVLIIKGNELKQPNRIIVTFSAKKTEFFTEILSVREVGKNEYTTEYKELTKDFYLAF